MLSPSHCLKGNAMHNYIDRQSLRKMYDDDPTARKWLVRTRCTACITIIALIAIIGLSDQANTTDSTNIAVMNASAGAAQALASHSAEEGRQRFRNKNDQHAAAGTVTVQSEVNR